MWFPKVDRLLNFLHALSGHLWTPGRTPVLYVRLANWWLKIGSVASWACIPFLEQFSPRAISWGQSKVVVPWWAWGKPQWLRVGYQSFNRVGRATLLGRYGSRFGRLVGYQEIDQMNKYIYNESKVRHCWKSYTERGKAGMSPGVGLQLETSVWIQFKRWRCYYVLHQHTHTHTHTHTQSSGHWEGLGATIPQEQGVYLALRHWLLNNIFY